jgi:eukaryotic-like serine/threonine-protein kinase
VLIGCFGDYELIKELGRGDTAIVYQARDPCRNLLAALKLFRVDAVATEDGLRRLENEAQIVAMLDHPHIVPVFEIGECDRRAYIGMKLINGPSLDRKLGEFTGDLKASERLVKTLAEAMHYVHERGVLHLDLKPDNVVIDELGEPYLIDFGLSQRIQAGSALFQNGAIRWTPAYMAPEQAPGQHGRVTAATDTYGLGAILYALITGRAPFEADAPAQTLAQVRYATPEPPSKRLPWISRDLDIIVLKCLEKEPERRYSSTAALADDLRRHLNGKLILPRLS